VVNVGNNGDISDLFLQCHKRTSPFVSQFFLIYHSSTTSQQLQYGKQIPIYRSVHEAPFVGEGLDPPEKIVAVQTIREGQDPPLQSVCKNKQCVKLEVVALDQAVFLWYYIR
jgi:hypothetical protein